MDNPTVVILTDPATCQISHAETLLHALLQIQQISKEGVSTSQAFCDHPAAAMQFIDAYAKAFPDLQQQSSNLPLPEHLYSMVADGRFGPLPAPAESEVPRIADDARSLQPLYVLSLGVPEALMQALQHNNLAQSKIHILEIAPVQQAKAEAVSVAEAVASDPVAAWLADTSSTQSENRDGILAAGALPTEDALKMASVEVNLDQIQVDRRGHDHDQAHDDPPPPAAIAPNLAPAGPGPVNPGPAPQSLPTEVAAPSGTMIDPAPPAASVAATPANPEPARPASPEPGTMLAPVPAEAPPPAEQGADPPSTPRSDADGGATNPPAGTEPDAPPPDPPAAGDTPSASADDQQAHANEGEPASLSSGDAGRDTGVPQESTPTPPAEEERLDASSEAPQEEPETTADGAHGDAPTVVENGSCDRSEPDHPDDSATRTPPADAMTDAPPDGPLTDAPPDEADATTGDAHSDAPTVVVNESGHDAAHDDPAADEPSDDSEETSSSGDGPTIAEPDDVDPQVSSTSAHSAEEASSGQKTEEHVVAAGEPEEYSSSFAQPGEDVSYLAVGSLAAGEDLIYAPPADLLPEGGILDGILESSEWTEVVDLGALHDDVAEVGEALTGNVFDLVLMPPAADWRATDGHSASVPASDRPASHDERPLDDEDAPYNPDLPPLHDDL